MRTFPKLHIHESRLKNNILEILHTCQSKNIQLAGVIKGFNSLPEIASIYSDCHVDMLAVSRVEQISKCKAAGITTPFFLVRIPIPSQIPLIIKECDLSINTELSTMISLDTEARKQHKQHKIIVMVDLDETREGYQDFDQMLDDISYVEKHLTGIKVVGIGVNFSCHRCVAPSTEKLKKLIDIADQVETRINRKLDYITVGGTSCLINLYDGTLPERINLLRIGEAIIVCEDLQAIFGYHIEGLLNNCITLRGEIAEIKEKHLDTSNGRVFTRQALVGIGTTDYGSVNNIEILDKDCSIINATSDLTAVDIKDCKRNLQLGDELEFKLSYSALALLSK